MKTIKKTIIRLKGYLADEQNEDVKLGIYMCLQTIKNDLEIENPKLIKMFELEEDLEKYL